jgi:hypothetical protein
LQDENHALRFAYVINYVQLKQCLVLYYGARIYEILHHPEAFTVQTIAAVEHIKGRHHAKVVLVKSGGST